MPSWISIFSDPARSTKFNIDSAISVVPLVFPIDMLYKYSRKIVCDLELVWFIIVDA